LFPKQFITSPTPQTKSQKNENKKNKGTKDMKLKINKK
jgi:hypothetical protein